MTISIKPEPLFHIGSLDVTNTLFTSWIVVLGIVLISVFCYKKLQGKTSKGKIFIETIFEQFMGFMQTFAGSREKVITFLPLVATVFFYILIANWFGTFPGVESIGLHTEHEGKEVFLPLLRTVNSDINMTLAIAFLVVITSHIVGFSSIGAKHHIGKFIVNPLKKPIGFFVGILELIGEVSRVISLTFRLFGNIFAGSVLMLIISSLVSFIIPIPFLAMELFVGFIQALVFATLTMMFMTSATALHEED